jgi:hypothetical protein
LQEAKIMGWDIKMDGIAGRHLNPSICPYNYIKIFDKVYKRDNTSIFEGDIPLDELVDMPCHDCGVIYGTIHHVECDCERCPQCHEQLLSCGCTVDGARYYKGLGDSVGKRHKDLFQQGKQKR